jgi:hypothetical protein
MITFLSMRGKGRKATNSTNLAFNYFYFYDTHANGQKRCQICEIFIRWDELWCPCCVFRLRI